MIDETKLKESFKQFCKENGLENSYVDVQLYRINDNFYKDNNTAWDKIQDTYGDWIHVDLEMWFKTENPEVPDDLEMTQEVFDALVDGGFIDDVSLWQDEDGDIFADVDGVYYEDLKQELKDALDAWWEDITIEDARNIEAIGEALNIGDIEDRYVVSRFIDELAYWTTFFEPCIEDKEAAFRSNLLPFTQDDVFMLGLGGAGEDLQPALDCYQALTDGSLPSNSKALSPINHDYFNYVSPIKVVEILEMCKLHTPKVVFTAFEKLIPDAKKFNFSFIGYLSTVADSEEEAKDALDYFREVPEVTDTWEIMIDNVDETEHNYTISFMASVRIEADSEEEARDQIYDIFKKFYNLAIEDIKLEE